MTKKKNRPSERQTITVEVECDHNRLYGPLDAAIEYLTEIRQQYAGTDISLDEVWTGYENMHMAFIYTRQETDEEYNARLEQERLEEERQAEQAKKDAETAKRRKQWEKLNREFGPRSW